MSETCRSLAPPIGPRRRPRASRPRAWLTAAALGCAVAGCGHVASAGRGGTLQVAVTEYRVTPQEVRVSPGSLSIVVRNDGRLTHDLVLQRDGETMASTDPIAPGQTGELVTTVSPGRYTMASTVLADQALGAYGTLRVH